MTSSIEDKIIFLLYHEMDNKSQPPSVDSADDLSVVVSENDFREQLSYMQANQFNILTVENALGGSPNIKQDRKNVVITFDDGKLSDWSIATKALIDFNFSAMFYIVSGKVDNDETYVTSDNLREMHSNGMEIGSHSVTHRFLPLLSEKEIVNELKDSKAQLEDIIGAAVKHFALPGGHGSKRIRDLAKECGYESIASCEIGTLKKGNDQFKIPRLEIRRNLGIDEFGQTFLDKEIKRLARIENAKSLLRRTLGLRNYTKLRQIAHSIFEIKR